MTGPLDGIRVLEVAAWTFVPAAAALLGDMGAEIIKVEPPTGDPQRALRNALNASSCGPNPFVEIPNHGKRSVTLDLKVSEGRAFLDRLVMSSDVFMTSYLPSTCADLGIDVNDLRAVNPQIVYARGTGWGRHGPMAETGGFDLAAAWAVSGLAHRLEQGTDGAPSMPPAFFDLQASVQLSGAVSAALFGRERTGTPSVIDVALMNVAMWAVSPHIVSAPYTDRKSTRLNSSHG